jgi:hypothetical protein
LLLNATEIKKKCLVTRKVTSYIVLHMYSFSLPPSLSVALFASVIVFFDAVIVQKRNKTMYVVDIHEEKK